MKRILFVLLFLSSALLHPKELYGLFNRDEQITGLSSLIEKIPVLNITIIAYHIYKSWGDSKNIQETIPTQDTCDLDEVRSDFYPDPDQSEKQRIYKNFEAQKYSYTQAIEESQELNEIYQEYGIGDSSHLQNRVNAYDIMQKERGLYTVQTYVLSQNTMQTLNRFGRNSCQYSTCYGNQLQQALHQECIHIVDHVAALSPQSTAYDYRDALLNFTDAAREYNQAGFTSHSSTILDVCHTILDYGQAILEGAMLGTTAAVIDIVEHPIQAGLCLVASEYVLAFQLSILIFNVAELGLLAAINPEKGAEKLHSYLDPIDKLTVAINNKEISVRDAIKGSTAFAVGWKAQSTLFGGLRSMCKTAKTKAITFTQNNPAFKSEQYLVTPEGFVVKAMTKSHQNKNNFEYSTLHSTIRNGAQHISIKQATLAASNLGFKKTKYYSHGQPIFQKGNRFITIDIDSHNGGFWKMADSIENLRTKARRMGTYDESLNRIGD